MFNLIMEATNSQYNLSYNAKIQICKWQQKAYTKSAMEIEKTLCGDVTEDSTTKTTILRPHQPNRGILLENKNPQDGTRFYI